MSIAGLRLQLSNLSILALILAIVFSVSPVCAGEWKLEPNISWQGIYDDNILFNNESDYVSNLKPGLQVSRRTDRSNIDLSGLVSIIRYLDNSEYDRENQDYRLSAGYNVSPRMSVNISSRLGIDYSFDEYFEEQGLVTAKIKRYFYDISPGLRLALDDLSSLTFNVYYRSADYSFDIKNDYDVLGGGLTWSRTIMDGHTDIFMSTGFEKTVYDLSQGESEWRVYRLLAGARHRLSETLDLSFSAGPRWTESRYSALNIKEDDLSYTVEGALNWRLERSRLNLGVVREETQSIYGENIVRNRVRAGITHDISPRWRARVSGAFTQNQTDGLVRKRESETINFDTSLSYVLRQNMDLGIGYNFRRNQDKVTNQTEKANRIYLSFAVSFPRAW